MLIWQNNTPRFVLHEYVGDRMHLYFGSTNIDDIEIANFYLVLRLLKQEDGWSLDTQSHQIEIYPGAHMPNVSRFISKLKLAVERGKGYDFSKVLDQWRRKYSNFHVAILTDTTLPGESLPVKTSP